jgi:hypothetical protein
MENLTIRTIGCSMASVAALCYLSIGNTECRFQLPIEGTKVQLEANVFPFAFSNPYYSLISEEQVALHQIETLHKFVSTILDKSQDLNPDFSAVVDKHFWDLV